MADFTQSRTFKTAQYPVHAIETSGLLRRTEPFLTPELFESRYLLGIPNFIYNKHVFTPEVLKDRIMMAMNETEGQLGTTITREEFVDKMDFDWSSYIKAFIHLKPRHTPIISIESLAIVASNDEIIFQVPSVWIECSSLSMGYVHVVPLLAAFGASSTTGSPITVTNQGAGIAFLACGELQGQLSTYPDTGN